MIGLTLGHYRIVEKIGEGGMGVVYRARDEQLDREVALKVLPPGALADEATRKRFRKEALALAKLNHPNIEAVHEFGTQDGLDFLAMEYVPGATLAERLAAGAVPEKEVLTLGAQIAAALEEAHEQGVVHRDLKPGNIVVTPKAQAKVLDFGLAKLLRPKNEISTADQLSSSAAVAGTLPYMSPEQLRGKPADARGDIYAVGAVLYEMATGKRPFREEVATALVDDILHKPPPPPGRLKHDLSPRLEEIILKCLEKEPENRYQSAKELGVDLRRLAMPSSITTAPAMRAPATWRKVAIRAAYGAAGLLVLVAMLVGINAGGWRERMLGTVSPQKIQSLAVLPLENLSHDSEQDYFADGMTDEMITELSKLSALRVISRTSVMQYKGAKKPLHKIAEELKVEAVVEGSVLRSGDRVRINVKLIHASDDRQLWAESYERGLGAVLALQSDVAYSIAREIRIKLKPQERAHLASAQPVNPAAHEAYLKGMYFSNRGVAEKAAPFFEQAIATDPNYAAAYAGLANSLLFRSPTSEFMPKAENAALKALELDENLPQAHAALGLVKLMYKWDWSGAEKAFQRALELDPGNQESHLRYSHYLAAMGKLDEAIAVARRAQTLDPLSPLIGQIIGRYYYFAGQLDRAIEEDQKTLELDPNFSWSHLFLSFAYEQKGMYEQAFAHRRQAWLLFGMSPERLAEVDKAYRVQGYEGILRKQIEFDEQNARRGLMASANLPINYLKLGDKEKALYWLKKAYENHTRDLIYLRVEPQYDPLRSDPRFQDLQRRIGFPQ